MIKQLVQIYDRPPGEEDIATRRTEVIKLHYSKAQDVATALKEVYRDLLSSKDKEFQGGENRQSGRSTTYYFSRGPSNDKEKKPKAVKVKFEGALSVGVDTISNTLIVSAQEEVWDSVREIVERLDEAAKPDTVVRLHRVDGSVSARQPPVGSGPGHEHPLARRQARGPGQRLRKTPHEQPTPPTEQALGGKTGQVFFQTRKSGTFCVSSRPRDHPSRSARTSLECPLWFALFPSRHPVWTGLGKVLCN